MKWLIALACLPSISSKITTGQGECGTWYYNTNTKVTAVYNHDDEQYYLREEPGAYLKHNPANMGWNSLANLPKVTFDLFATEFQQQKLLNAKAALEMLQQKGTLGAIEDTHVASDYCHFGYQCMKHIPADKTSSQKLFQDLASDFMCKVKNPEISNSEIVRIMSKDGEAIIYVDLEAKEDFAFGLTQKGEYLWMNFGIVDKHRPVSEAEIEKRFHELMKAHE